MIQDVIITEIKKYSDKRGWLKEIHRLDETSFQPAMSYVSHTNYNQIRGPHEHKYQSDFFVFVGPGDFVLYLWDNRSFSESYGAKQEITVGETKNVSVLVPPGVVHGYKSITKTGSFSINLPDKLYAGVDRKEEIDEIRHETMSYSKFKID